MSSDHWIMVGCIIALVAIMVFITMQVPNKPKTQDWFDRQMAEQGAIRTTNGWRDGTGNGLNIPKPPGTLAYRQARRPKPLQRYKFLRRDGEFYVFEWVNPQHGQNVTEWLKSPPGQYKVWVHVDDFWGPSRNTGLPIGALGREMARRGGMGYFQVPLSDTTDPAEVFGPPDFPHRAPRV